MTALAHVRPLLRLRTTSFVLASSLLLAVSLTPSIAQAITELIIDNAVAGAQDPSRTFSGKWCVSGGTGSYGTASIYSCGTGQDSYRWSFAVPISGDYDVYVRWTTHANRSAAVPFAVLDDGGLSTKSFNQKVNGGQWQLHGRYTFSAGVSKYVEVNDSTGLANADGVRLVAAAGDPPPTSGQATLSVATANAAAGSIRVYPADVSGRGDGAPSLSRTYALNTRVWLTAPLRAGYNYFSKWQKNGVDFDRASTISMVMNGDHLLTAVYVTPNCSGVAVAPGVDSLKSAVAAAPAGSTFCIKSGVHRFSGAVVARANDKFIGETGAILNGSKLLTSFVREGTRWVATGQTQQEPHGPAVVGAYAVCFPDSPGCILPERVFRDGKDLQQVNALADLATGKFYFDYAADKIYLFDDPTGHTIVATNGSGGIIGYNGAGQNSVTVKNLIFERFGGGEVTGSIHSALKTAEGWTVENNELRYISEVCVLNFGNGAVRNNNIHHCGRSGLGGGGLIEGNVISNNNIDGFDPGFEAGGSKFHSIRGLVVRSNTAAKNRGAALWSDFDNLNTIYENNFIENNTVEGIFHEISCGGVIRYNVLRGNNATYAGRSLWYGAQIYLRSSKDMDIIGNDVSAVGTATHGIGLRGGDAPRSGANCGTIEMRNISARDNIIRLDTGDLTGWVGSGRGGAAALRLGFFGNTYYLRSLGGTNFNFDDSIQNLTKEQWQAGGQDINGKFLPF